MSFLPATIKGQHGVIVVREHTLLYHYEGHKHMSDFGNPRRKCKIGTGLISFVMSDMYVHHAYTQKYAHY